jgi:hypothetical protein
MSEVGVKVISDAQNYILTWTAAQTPAYVKNCPIQPNPESPIEDPIEEVETRKSLGE